MNSDLVRFWSKVGYTDLNGCWVWKGAAFIVGGYGAFRLGQRMIKAHRYSYELIVGKVPDGKELHHICHIPNCVNPAHLQPVTRKEHIHLSDNICHLLSKREFCPKGHPLTQDNLRPYSLKKLGTRVCAQCHRDYEHDRRVRRKNEVAI